MSHQDAGDNARQWLDQHQSQARPYSAAAAKVIRDLLAEITRLKGEVEKATSIRKRLESELARCYVETGADPDSNSDSILATHALDEVRRLRKDHDAAEAKLAQAEASLTALRKLAGEFVAVIDKRHYGRMPDEVQVARDALKAGLDQLLAPPEQSTT